MTTQLKAIYESLIAVESNAQSLSEFVESEYNKILNSLNIVTKRGTKASFKDMHRIAKEDYEFVTEEFRHAHNDKEVMALKAKESASKVQSLFVQAFLNESGIDCQVEAWMPEFSELIEVGKKYCQSH